MYNIDIAHILNLQPYTYILPSSPIHTKPQRETGSDREAERQRERERNKDRQRQREGEAAGER